MKIKNIKSNKNVLIIGCGRLGASIANTFSDKNMSVTIIDIQKDSFRKLSPSFLGLLMEGDGMDMDILEEANIRKADVVIVVTDNDNINILVSQIAKNIFEVEEVIIRLYDHEKECVCRDSNINTIFPALLSSSEVDKILMV
ncbi:NAD-binding protein [Clostridium sp.]|jgi:trk system potassium uptake protein TrkA|uniref:potassium channel family protein n=1 Tax=Clostridium sp. TaxID=1506 RepID=UPI0025C705DF|nr:NAD-binding protein [Clostridium sp.]MCI9070755.1 TrkA family potassium uptake protein [Clostridium sp.]